MTHDNTYLVQNYVMIMLILKADRPLIKFWTFPDLIHFLVAGSSKKVGWTVLHWLTLM